METYRVSHELTASEKNSHTHTISPIYANLWIEYHDLFQESLSINNVNIIKIIIVIIIIIIINDDNHNVSSENLIQKYYTLYRFSLLSFVIRVHMLAHSTRHRQGFPTYAHRD